MPHAPTPTGGERLLRVVHPLYGEVTGSAEEVAQFFRSVSNGSRTAASGQAALYPPASPAKPLRKLPNNEELVADYQQASGVSKSVRGNYVSIVREFERTISPKSFIDAGVDDVLRYARMLDDVCKHRKSVYLGGFGVISTVPRLKCQRGEYDLTLTPPETCSRACPKWEQQLTGPAGRLGGLSNFYDWLELRGLVPTNIVRLPQKSHADSLPPTDKRGKYAPLLRDVQDLLRAARIRKTPREVAVFLFLAKTGRRPGHVMRLNAQDLYLTREGVSWVTFDGVRSRIRRESGHSKTKLRGEIVSIIDAELRDHLLDHYLPWRLKRYGLAYNEGPLFVGRHTGHMDLTTIQNAMLDPIMTGLRDEAAGPERERWARHLDGEKLERITPGCFRHFFSTTLKKLGVQDGDIDILRGDKIEAARGAYLDLTLEDLAAIYRMPTLLDDKGTGSPE